MTGSDAVPVAAPPPTALLRVLADLTAEGDDLDALVSPLTDDAWRTPTPAEGWTVADQVGHLAWTDDVARVAAGDARDGTSVFAEVVAEVAADLAHAVDWVAAEYAAAGPADLLGRWRRGRASLADALRAVPEGARLPWFGPPMSATSMATARLMETWAHGQDVADALGVTRVPTSRLRHVAHLGVRTRAFAYAVHGRTAPEAEIRVELTPPDGGEPWTWGPADAADRVTGPALDFCLLVTQRRHRNDLAVETVGDAAAEWLPIAQAFAGPPGPGRAPHGTAP